MASTKVWIYEDLFGTLASRGLDPESLRKAFSDYKQGDESAHKLFCHDVGSDPGCYLRHVHFIPTDSDSQKDWLEMFKDRHKRKRRTSDRYVLYASDASYGFLLIDILDDPGAHNLWKQRRTKLAGYEKVASEFCTFGPQKVSCR